MTILKQVLLALLLTGASASMPYDGGERALYGHEGNPADYYQVREVAGWPAAFLTDNPNTSVPHKIGPEDDFRHGPFLACFSFWLLLVNLITRLAQKIRTGHRNTPENP